MVKIHKRGFTLIEILVVMSIITFATSIIFGSLSDARARARDEERIRNINEIKNALALYKSDNKHYPCILNASSNSNWNFYRDRWEIDLANELSPYIKNLPSDPLDEFNWDVFTFAIRDRVYTYSYTSFDHFGNGLCANYDLTTKLETDHPLRCGNQNTPYFSKYPYTNFFYTAGKSYYYCNCLGLIDSSHGCYLSGDYVYQDH